ncbi:unnamed protein product [Albugo candida]|uniref:Uncharacterized protein n=1 Tax=Albugo candida TaxID=65357 RepID=A0A024GR37_9STRA|nr:unnamed protein product [Albugo candida]|eukprot:CCI49362.1 unnamed protein product [Albugo candida]
MTSSIITHSHDQPALTFPKRPSVLREHDLENYFRYVSCASYYDSWSQWSHIGCSCSVDGVGEHQDLKVQCSNQSDKKYKCMIPHQDVLFHSTISPCRCGVQRELNKL